MTGWVEVDPDVLLGLEVRQHGSRFEGVLTSRGQVIHPDIEVYRHLLVAGRAGHTGRT